MKPVLFLDFDRTLFDTDLFYEWLGPNRFERILALTGGVIDPPDYAAFLYPDSVHFLRQVRKTHRVVILTYAVNTLLQRKKIRGSGVAVLVDDVLITSGGEKNHTGKGEQAKEYLARIPDSGWEHAFVDDSSANIDEVKRVNPDIRCIRIDRTPLATNFTTGELSPPDFVVANLIELKKII